MSLPIVQPAIATTKLHCVSKDNNENVQKVLDVIKDRQPVLMDAILGLLEQYRAEDVTADYVNGFIAGACVFYSLLDAQAECDDLEGH